MRHSRPMPALPPPRRTVSVSLLALPESTPTALFGLFEVLSSAGVTWSVLTGENAECPSLRPRIVAEEIVSFCSPVGIPITPQATLSDTAATDIVIVTDLDLTGLEDPRRRWPAAVAWIRDQFASGALVCSVCTGSVLLAEAGLLDELEATTHWSATSLFEACYPAVRLRPERILCPAGPEHRVVTAGGSASWEDLALYLVARFCGQREAVRTAKIFLFGDRSEGQLPYATMPRPRRHTDAVVARCQAWIAMHYAMPNPVTRLIEQSGLPERTFARRFKAATGYAPVDYVQTLRIEEAKQLLETTDEPTDAVAAQVGYDDPTFFRRLFKRRTGITPARYRQRFQSLLPLPHHRGCPPVASGSR